MYIYIHICIYVIFLLFGSLQKKSDSPAWGVDGWVSRELLGFFIFDVKQKVPPIH